MKSYIIKLFIKDYKNYTNALVRASYGKLSGIVGIISNTIICIMKITIGFLIGSVSIMADGINNLSDAASSVITLVGFKLSSVPADSKHPYGHQRIEYVTGLIISFIILIIGAILMKSSIEGITNKQILEFSWIAVIIMVVSLIIKIWQSSFYRFSGKLISSKALIASSQDSLNDCLSTSAVLIAYLVSKFSGIYLDGYMGILVSIFIIFSGFKLIKETISLLIGEAPSKEYIDEITNKILSYNGVLGLHDLVIHSYGPAKTFITVHVEVDSKVDVVESHDIIDNIEHDFMEDGNLNVVIHMDPINLDCSKTNKFKDILTEVLSEINMELRFHDFRIVEGPSHNKMIFDIEVPSSVKLTDEEIKEQIIDKMKKIDKKLILVITIDKNYII